MLEQLSWLVKDEELQFRDLKFKGAAAGKSWKYAQSIDGIIRTRALIMIMSVMILYPVATNYLFHDHFSSAFLVERLIFCIVFLLAAAIFNRFRIVAILIAAIPLLLILVLYLSNVYPFSAKRVGFIGGMLVMILSGIYHHIRSRQLKKELNIHLENQSITA